MTGMVLKRRRISPTHTGLIGSGGTFATNLSWLIKHYVVNHSEIFDYDNDTNPRRASSKNAAKTACYYASSEHNIPVNMHGNITFAEPGLSAKQSGC